MRVFFLALIALSLGPDAFGDATLGSPRVSTEISYGTGQAGLDTFDRQALDVLIRDAKARGTVQEVSVISWGDVDYPQNNDPMPAPQVDLARSRNRAVESYLSGNGFPVKTYNMAMKPTALEELLNTADAQLKQALVGAGVSSSRTSQKNAKSLVIVRIR